MRGPCAILVPTILVAAVAAVVPSPAQAAGAPAWGPVSTVATARSMSRPDVVVDRVGVTTVVWRTPAAVLAVRQDAAGHRGRPIRLGHGTAPQVGVDGSRTLTAVWTRHRPGFGPQVVASRRPPGSPWSRPSAVSPAIASQDPAAHGAFEPDLAVSHDGAVLVSWLREPDDSGASRVQARYRPAGQGWDPIVTLSALEARSPVSAIADGGRAVVVYTRFARVHAVRRAPGGWTSRRQIGAHAEPPQVAMDDRGGITAVWSALEGDGVFRPVAATRPVGGPWTAPQTLDPALQDPLTAPEPVVASGPRGRSTAAWVRPGGEVVAANRAPNGSWTAPRQVAAPTDPALLVPPFIDLTIGRSGSTLLSWTRRAGSSRYLEAAFRPAGQGWQPPARLSPSGVDAAAAQGFVSGANRAVASWRARDGTDDLLQLRELHP